MGRGQNTQRRRLRAGEEVGIGADGAPQERDRPTPRDKGDGRVNWKAVFFLALVVVPGVLGALFGLMDFLGKNGVAFSSSPPDARSRLTEFYRQHNPAKIGEVDKLLRKYKGREDELFQKLEEKYA